MYISHITPRVTITAHIWNHVVPPCFIFKEVVPIEHGVIGIPIFKNDKWDRIRYYLIGIPLFKNNKWDRTRSYLIGIPIFKNNKWDRIRSGSLSQYSITINGIVYDPDRYLNIQKQ